MSYEYIWLIPFLLLIFLSARFVKDYKKSKKNTLF